MSSPSPSHRRRTAASYPLPIRARAVDADMQHSVSTVQKLLNYSFRDPTLLEEALTHSSCPQRQSFQRLEFVGDAVLTLAFSNHLYLTHPHVPSGGLSTLRAANISTEKLARVAVTLKLYDHLRRNSPNLDKMVEQFTKEVVKEQEEATGKVPYGGTTMKAPKVLADMVEGIAAAIYLDCGSDLETLWEIFRKHLEPIIIAATMDEQPVTTLYKLCQKHGMKLEYTHGKNGSMTITNVLVKGELVGTGSSEQKAISKLNATRDALQNLQAYLALNPPLRIVRDKDGAKKRLNDLCTKNHWPTAVYRVEEEEGPAHDKKFVCSVQVETCSNVFVSMGEEKAKVKDAENSCAEKMLEEIMSRNEV